MADRTGEVAAAPAIVLAAPQLGENIGTAARAMANFGVTDLRLVAPRDGWPNEKARSASSGADHVIDHVRVFDTVAEAVADLSFVIATTRRPRGFTKRVEGPADGLAELVGHARRGARTGILFGRERWGLENDEVAQANIIVTFPVDPNFASLNMAQSVLLMAYEWRRAMGLAADIAESDAVPATREEVNGLWRHLVSLLEPSGYFRPDDMAKKMERNLLLILSDAGWDKQQVRTLRGVLAHLGRRAEAVEPVAEAEDGPNES
ncbi:RNA methyltransferase [Acuticoccus mangrovi]|uniref:RNA methyltransferase n=1 Tax=Acuticoccus mangrovi TaxID=2796142 RepID=A0A934IPB2_9HYPH|nr:RNA methyltransferase [Acuticoccus mangrovi]MBJ3777557.1 RNA methyltransferase [Acuticoccus mangrovi]